MSCASIDSTNRSVCLCDETLNLKLYILCHFKSWSNSGFHFKTCFVTHLLHIAANRVLVCCIRSFMCFSSPFRYSARSDLFLMLFRVMWQPAELSVYLVQSGMKNVLSWVQCQGDEFADRFLCRWKAASDLMTRWLAATVTFYTLFALTTDYLQLTLALCNVGSTA